MKIITVMEISNFVEKRLKEGEVSCECHLVVSYG